MFAKRELVRGRRIRRRLKAAASILVAVAAGTFLACQRGVETAKQVLDAGRKAGDDAQASQDGAAPGEARDASAVDDAATASARADAKPDALVRAPGPRDAAVDAREHRKGMPVPDNLLE